MRALNGLFLCMAATALAAAESLPARAQFQDHDAGARPGLKAADAQDGRIALEEIRRLRGRRVPSGQIAETLAEEGRAFEVTADIARELRSLGFSAAQITAIKSASPDPLVPGKWVSYSEATRDSMLDAMQQAAVKSGAAIQSASSRHATLWAAKDLQSTYLPDLQKAEKFFHTKCAEPIRCGLDKRSSHIVLLRNHAEYEAWWRAMFELHGDWFDEKDNPGGNAQFRKDVLAGSGFHCDYLCTISVAEAIFPEWVHRNIAFAMGYQSVAQLATRSDYWLKSGFGNCSETALWGFPAVTCGAIVYGKETERAAAPHEDWGLLVKQRLITRKATPLAELLKAVPDAVPQAIYAERWTLVGLLNQQPAKFGKLLLTLKESDSDLAAIKKIYGWDEKELNRQWRTYGTSLGKRKPAGK